MNLLKEVQITFFPLRFPRQYWGFHLHNQNLPYPITTFNVCSLQSEALDDKTTQTGHIQGFNYSRHDIPLVYHHTSQKIVSVEGSSGCGL